MKNFLCVLLFLASVANIAKSQSINYENPLWAFDYMRNAWKNNIDFLEVEKRIAADSIYVGADFRDYYGQALMTVQTFNGNIKGKNQTNNQFRHSTKKLKESEMLNKQIHPADAGKFIIENFSDEKIIMFNEAHLYPQHRTFIHSLLTNLYHKGYKHLFMETLSAEQPVTQYPERETGIYTNEPCMANLVRTAIQTGFSLHAYDGYSYANRDSASARNIYNVIRNNPDDKFIVICGFDHNNEKKSQSLASYLKQITQIDPLTVDLTIYSEPESSEYYDELISFYQIDHPSVLIGKHHKHIVMKNSSGRDLYVIFPPTVYIHNYPKWMINQHENKWYSISFNDFDVAKVYIKEELEQISHPVPYSFKYNDGNKYFLVPKKDFVVKFYKLKDKDWIISGIYDSSDMKFNK